MNAYRKNANTRSSKKKSHPPQQSKQFKLQENKYKIIDKHKNLIFHSTQTQSHHPFLNFHPPYYYVRTKINCTKVTIYSNGKELGLEPETLQDS